MFDKKFFQGFRDMVDSLEESVQTMLTSTKPKPIAYSVATSYTINSKRYITSYVIIASDEDAAIRKIKAMVCNNALDKDVKFHNAIANKVSTATLDRIKKDC